MSNDPAGLENLRDLVLPPAASWWPPAVGWRIVAAGLAAAGLVVAVRAIARYRANAYRREALRRLAALESEIGAGANDAVATEIMELLKRAALAAFPRPQIASLTGRAWLSFLDRTGRMTAFTSDPANRLAEALYRPTLRLRDTELRVIVGMARRWLKAHGPVADDAPERRRC